MTYGCVRSYHGCRLIRCCETWSHCLDDLSHFGLGCHTLPASPTPYIRLKPPTVGDFPYKWQPWHRIAAVYTSAWQAGSKFGLAADLTGWVVREI
ncbi:hypothetical protein E2C01_012151 [Portunus trituberculatus]|uniref:Uncharacterized protein n=1 Tax=Portunus trituberculatus TaxID=210409 RepID=A0A5B7DDC5_PORTR|nr:hypothetical protein [Portunus trituberculatus]